MTEENKILKFADGESIEFSLGKAAGVKGIQKAREPKTPKAAAKNTAKKKK